MNLRNILLVAVILVILYLVYNYVFLDSTSNVLYKGGNAKNAFMIKANKLPGNPGTVDFTYSVWIYIKDWQYRYGTEKVIFNRNSGSEGTEYITMALADSSNTLKVNLGINPKGQSTSMEVDNIPLQKWCHLLISTNNRAIDMYIDGKLVKTAEIGRAHV